MVERPSPEKLLRLLHEEERQTNRGKLKIYLGAAPGVGKTYAMLEDALGERALGLDVLIGIVESHGRKELDAFIKGFEILPKQTINYKGRELQEFDLDSALIRMPALILIDEMAHTNVPGLRHEKRWMDIKELLDRGIDVYTTLNVQHIESLNYVVSQIIHVPIKEIVPDSMIEIAESIELVDISSEDLLKRLQEGKVYIPKQAVLAAENFFKKGHLIALRALALRAAAELVSAQVISYRQMHGISQVWPTTQRILVCIGPNTESIKLMRAAKRLAKNLQVEWIAVYVDTPKLQASEKIRTKAINNLRLAQRLGAETRILTGFDVVKEIMDFAREQNVTLIMIWKNIRSRFRDLFFRSLTNELVRHSHEIDVYVMTGTPDDVSIQEKSVLPKKTSIFQIYLASFFVVAIATILNYLLLLYFQDRIAIMVYILAVIIVALLGQRGPSLLASILSAVAYVSFCIPPSDSFAVSHIKYLFTFIFMLTVTLVISNLVLLTRHQAESARFAERQAAALHSLSRRLASTRGVYKLLDAGVRYIADTFKCDVLGLLPKDRKLVVRSISSKGQVLDEKEKSIAQWVYDLGQVAGYGTDTLPFSDSLYVPLLASRGTIGVLRLRPKMAHQFTPEELRLLDICANQIALALEVDRLQGK